MKIKGQNGEEMNATSQSQGTINTVLASIGALGALTMGGGLLGRATSNTSSNRGVDSSTLGRDHGSGTHRIIIINRKQLNTTYHG